jgi:hypothetical protein
MSTVRTSIRALSIRQPWAWLVANGYKDVENRSWPTPHRGDTLIHAGQVFDSEGLAWVRSTFPQLRDVLPQQFELGGIVGFGQVVQCADASASPWFVGPWAHVFHGARPLPFVRHRGELGYFAVPITDALHAALRHTTPAQSEDQPGLFA